MIIFLYGQDVYRRQKKVKELKNKFIQDIDPSGESVAYINGSETSMSELSKIGGAGSLFATKRLVVVENILANPDKTIFNDLKKYLEKINLDKTSNDNIWLFVDEHSGEKIGRNVLWTFLNKQTFVQNFTLLNPWQVARWIVVRAKELNAELSMPLAQQIVADLGNDLWRIDNELKKLVHYKKGQADKVNKNKKVVLTKADLSIVSDGESVENIFAFCDAVVNKNKQLALNLLQNELEADMAETYLLHMIIRQFKILLQLRQAIEAKWDTQKIIRDLKLHPYVVKKGLQQVRPFSLKILKDIFSQLIDLNKDIKLGQADFRVAMTLLITKL